MESISCPAILDGSSAEARRPLLSEAGLDRLQAVFAVVPDPRARRGRRCCAIATRWRRWACGAWNNVPSWPGGIPPPGS